jgi:ferredoxin-NADP reductase
MPTAKLIRREQCNDSTHLLTFRPTETFEFIGGQFIIIDSGLKNEEGKNYKRTYSLLSSDDKTDEFQIAYKALEKGIVTNQYLNHLQVDDVITFSGPWGKFLKDEDFFGEGDVFVLATDTALASALSFVNSKKLKQKENVSFYWMVSDKDYFLDFEMVQKRIPPGLAHFEIVPIAEYGSEGRDEVLHKAKSIANQHHNPRTALLAGDGIIVNKIKEYLIEKGVNENHIGTEVYFNKDSV